MEQSRWEAMRLVCQKLFHHLWNRKILYRVYKNLPLDADLSKLGHVFYLPVGNLKGVGLTTPLWKKLLSRNLKKPT
jgi:hypothetical protein